MEEIGIEYLLAFAGILAGLKPIGNLIVKLFQMLFKGHDWKQKQDSQSDDIEQLKKDTCAKLNELDCKYKKEIQEIKEEQSILVKGTLACLMGLREKGCDGPVKEGIEMLKDYLNRKAHE